MSPTLNIPWPPAVDVPERRKNYDEVRISFLILVAINEVLDNMFTLRMRPAKVVTVAIFNGLVVDLNDASV